MLRTRRLALWVALVAALLAHSSNALAQKRDWDPDTHRQGAGADIWLWSLPDAEFLSTAPLGFVNVEPIDDFWIDAWLPYNIVVGDPNERAAFGNPSIQFRYGPKMGITRWWVGGGVGIPLASIDVDIDYSLALYAGAASMGFYNLFLWADYMPLWATGGVDIRVVDFMSIQLSGEPMLYFDIDDDHADAVEFALQTRAGVEFRDPGSGVGGGVHVKIFWWPTDNFVENDLFQFSLQPFFGYTGDVFFLRFALLMPFDEPLGPFFDDNAGSVFSQELVLGGQW
jgi:hypothetical protein